MGVSKVLIYVTVTLIFKHTHIARHSYMSARRVRNCKQTSKEKKMWVMTQKEHAYTLIVGFVSEPAALTYRSFALAQLLFCVSVII